MSSHYFWAVKIPDEVKHEVKSRLDTVKLNFPFQRWVNYLDYHITLEFLGHAEKQQLELCRKGIEVAIRDMNSFQLHVTGLNVFGKMNMPSVFWASINYEETLMQLQKKVNEQCHEAKFLLDKRKYQPHLTLARKWIGEEPLQKNSLALNNPFHKTLSFLAEEVVLYTVNKDARPKYEPVSTIKLNC